MLHNNDNEPTLLLSIIMPVFNHPDDVALMIDCILANDFSQWEMILVDDGSDPSTLDMLHGFAAADSRIRVIRRDRLPKGAQTCRNIGLGEARGEYCVFFDSDDYVAPYCLGQRVGQMRCHTDLDFMVFPSGVFVDGRFLTGGHPYAFGYRLGHGDVEMFARRRLPFIVWNNIYRTGALRSHRLSWDERLLSLQDADFNMQAIVAGLRYGYATTGARPDYGYRIVNTSSISKKISTDRHVESHVYANERMYEMVQAVAGHKLDGALYDGTMSIYNANMTGAGINRRLADMLAASLTRRHSVYARLLRAQIWLTTVLERVLPRKVARQIPVVSYLVRKAVWQKRKARLINAIAGK